ncbi:MAG TPA: ROK family protein [Polyangiales bacterium]|nr:ROK family protein [Polyangiales bacterium]
MKILVIDVGGTRVKVCATGQKETRSAPSGPKLTAPQMVRAVKELTRDWEYEVISIGFPGPITQGRIAQEPHNLGPGWVGFDFANEFGHPVRLINDAAMQALGSYRGGSMLFLGLGAGLGSAMIVDGTIEPLELAHLPYRDGYTYDECMGVRGLERLGEDAWRAQVEDVAVRLKAAMQADDLVIGGGNSNRLRPPLPAGARLGNNDNAFLGGFALWETSRTPHVPSKARTVEVLRAASRSDVVVLFDVDNTLLDNDRVIDELNRYLQREVGVEAALDYFQIFYDLRRELGYADYLGALERFRLAHPHEPSVMTVASFMVDYPFANRLFPGALDVIEHLGRLGPTVIFTEGDVVFQPRKIERSGLANAVENRVLLYLHKDRELAATRLRFPADHYILVDDKIRILTAVKQQWGERVTTIFPQQGHYARDPEVSSYPQADVVVERISDLLQHDPKSLVAAAVK